MPQVQILAQQEDPNVASIKSAGENINDSIYKRQQIEVMKQELVIKSKLAQAEEEKLKIDRQRVFLDSMQKAMDQGVFKNERLAQGWMKMMGDNFGKEAFDFLATAGDSLKGFETPEGKLREAQAAEATATANQKEALVTRLKAMGNNPMGFEGGVPPPGTSRTVNPMTGEESYTIPMNPAVTPQASDTISKGIAAQELIPYINQAVDIGVFGNTPSQRTFSQARVEAPTALATAGNPELQSFQSFYNRLRQASLFDEAGKALTGTEKTEALRLLSLVGKDNETIKRDLNYLAQKNINKLNLILGGSQGAGNPRASVLPSAQEAPASPNASRFKVTPIE